MLEDDIRVAVERVAASHGYSRVDVTVSVIVDDVGPHVFARGIPRATSFRESHSGRTVEAVEMAAYRRTGVWVKLREWGVYAVASVADCPVGYMDRLLDAGFEVDMLDGLVRIVGSPKDLRRSQRPDLMSAVAAREISDRSA